jgi:hypothetical protein
MGVNEHDILFNSTLTKTQIKVKEQWFYCCSKIAGSLIMSIILKWVWNGHLLAVEAYPLLLSICIKTINYYI